jgi:hypothetical protein
MSIPLWVIFSVSSPSVLVGARVLGQIAYGFSYVVPLGGDIVSADGYLSGSYGYERRDHPKRRGLPGAVRSDEAKDLSLFDREVYSLDGLDVPVYFMHVLYAQGIHEALRYISLLNLLECC